MRDNSWLKKQLDFLLGKYFADVEIINPIDIRFGREAKYRFGSIRLISDKRIRGRRGIRSKISNFQFPHFAKALRGEPISNFKSKIPAKSVITITSMFAKENVPVDVVCYTICHELCHYAHGFSSTNKRLFKYPHHGGIVNKELQRRGAKHIILAFKKWLKSYRSQILAGRVSI